MTDNPVLRSDGDVDALSDALIHFPLQARIYASPRVCGTWRLNPSGHHQAGFHLISAGGCWLHQCDVSPLRLTAGDLVFVARDRWHVFASERILAGDDTVLDNQGDGPALELICGSVDFPDGTGQALLAGLPDILVVPAEQVSDRERVQSLARLMALECAGDAAGGRVIQDRLADVLVVLVLRHLMEAGTTASGLLAALADPHLSRALAVIHRDYEQPLSLNSLASYAGLSRSAFARRFAAMVGDTPVNYLSSWRMHHADRWLRERRYSVSQIASRLDYETEAAFRRAFKRIRGVAPGHLRRLYSQAPD